MTQPPADLAQSAGYDQIGRSYAATRSADPRIAAAILEALGDIRSLVNIGAGSGSYEPQDGIEVVAVEPSQVMIEQRPATAAPAQQGTAEALPLDDEAVDAALAILTVHHWSDIARAWTEIRRVARRRAVFFTWDPSSTGFWLTIDYFPEIQSRDINRFPTLSIFDELGSVETRRVPVPHDCADGFLATFWRQPHAYLDPAVRANMSGFAAIGVEATKNGLHDLERDLSDGRWRSRNRSLLDLPLLDVGYRIVICSLS